MGILLLFVVVLAPKLQGGSADLGARWSLRGKRALVTGGTMGIGRACVEVLAKAGCRVYTCGRDASALATLLADCEAQFGESVVMGSVCDVSDAEACATLVAEAVGALGGLDVLVNNVGTNVRKATVDFEDEDVTKVLDTNWHSAWRLTMLCYPHLSVAHGASVVFVSSVAGVVAIKTGSLYAITKAAMNQLAKNLACEWAPDNIRVNSVAP